MRIAIPFFILIFITPRLGSRLLSRTHTCSDFISSFVKYECEADLPIARGSVGSAFLVKERVRGGKYAILKVQFQRPRGSPELQFLEGEILDQAKHPNIIRLFEKRMVGDRMIEIMEYGSKGPLNNFLRTVPTVRSDRTRMLQMFRQIASAVRFLHQSGWVHADIKCDNIVVDEDWNLKLIDFDLTVPINALESPRGTVGYREIDLNSPQINSFFYDEKVDVFSLGAVFYEMVTGRALIPGRSRDQILQNMQIGDYVISKNTDVKIAYLIHRMLMKDRQSRYGMAQVTNLIDSALTDTRTFEVDKDITLSLQKDQTAYFPDSIEREVQVFVSGNSQRYNFVFRQKEVQKVPIVNTIIKNIVYVRPKDSNDPQKTFVYVKSNNSGYLVRLVAVFGLALVIFLTIVVFCRAKRVGLFSSSGGSYRGHTQRTVITRSVPVTTTATTTRVTPVVITRSTPIVASSNDRVIVRENVVVPSRQVVVRDANPKANSSHTTTVRKEVVSNGKVVSSTYQSTTQTRGYKS
jgi:serine/threonine protein kinase